MTAILITADTSDYERCAEFDAGGDFDRPDDWTSFYIGRVVRVFRTNDLGRIKVTLKCSSPMVACVASLYGSARGFPENLSIRSPHAIMPSLIPLPAERRNI